MRTDDYGSIVSLTRATLHSRTKEKYKFIIIVHNMQYETKKLRERRILWVPESSSRTYCTWVSPRGWEVTRVLATRRCRRPATPWLEGAAGVEAARWGAAEGACLAAPILPPRGGGLAGGGGGPWAWPRPLPPPGVGGSTGGAGAALEAGGRRTGGEVAPLPPPPSSISRFLPLVIV